MEDTLYVFDLMGPSIRPFMRFRIVAWAINSEIACCTWHVAQLPLSVKPCWIEDDCCEENLGGSTFEVRSG